MRLHRQRPAPPTPPEDPATPAKPDWRRFVEDDERPNREDLASQHNVFLDTMLEPVPMPRWLRGRSRPNRDKLS